MTGKQYNGATKAGQCNENDDKDEGGCAQTGLDAYELTCMPL